MHGWTSKRTTSCLLLALFATVRPATGSFIRTFTDTRVDAQIVEARLKNCPSAISARRERLTQLFRQVGCEEPSLERQEVRGSRFNVICTLKGESEATIIIGAHHDKAGNGDGVVDNWSGASLLPSLYQALRRGRRHHTFVFVSFTDEERGLNGSKHFVRKLSKEQKQAIKAMINIDCLGLSYTKLWWNKAGQEMADTLAGVARHLGVEVSGVDPSKVGRGDHQSFEKLGIPTLLVHSVTNETLRVLHCRLDNLKPVQMSDYYDSYRLLAAYLTHLDSISNSRTAQSRIFECGRKLRLRRKRTQPGRRRTLPVSQAGRRISGPCSCLHETTDTSMDHRARALVGGCGRAVLSSLCGRQ